MMKRNTQAGQSLLMVAFSMVAFLAMMGLAIDMGYVRYMQRQLQTAADNAALAGAMQLPYASNGFSGATSITTASLSASAEDNFKDGVNGVKVNVCAPPNTSGLYGACPTTLYAGTGSGPLCNVCVEVVVTDAQVPTFFSQNFGAPKNLTLSATAVAEGSLNCIFGLDKVPGASALSLRGVSLFGFFTVGAAVINSTCGVVDNSNFDNGIGFGLAGLCAPSFEMAGSIVGSTSGSCSRGGGFGGGFGGHITQPYPPTKLATPVADPFAYLVPPPIPSAITSNFCSAVSTARVISTPTTITAGTYCGGFQVVNSTLTFSGGGTFNIIGTTGNGGVGGIQLKGGFFGQSRLNFGPGTYNIVGGISDSSAFGSFVNYNTGGGNTLFVLYGGGLNLIGGGNSGNGSVGQGNGVTFYNTGTGGSIGSGGKTVANCPSCYGALTSYFDGFNSFCGGPCGLIAPTTGPYAGILFWQDVNNTQPASFVADFNLAAGDVFHQGAYYFPGSTVNFDFDFGTGAAYSYLVAKDIAWFFNFTFNRDTHTLPNGSPLAEGTATLVQ